MLETIIPEPKWENIFKLNQLIVGIELLLALLVGLIFIWLGIGGGAWILGGIVAGAIVFYFYHSLYNNQAKPNRSSRKIGQIIVGLTIGFSIKNSELTTISAQLPILVLLAFFLIISAGLIGYIYSRIQKTDLLTATLATVPGNIGIMASMAADYGKNTAIVSLVQLIRFTTVIIATPIIVKVSNPHDVGVIIHSLTNNLFIFNLKYLLLLSILLVITSLAVKLGTKLKIPVAGFFCSILVGIFFDSWLNLVPLLQYSDFQLPPLINFIGQVLLGITIGEYWGINHKLERRTIALALIPVSLTFLAALLSAGIARLFTPWDWLTCLLVTSPGGSPEMILISLAMHRNVEIVTAGHLIRLIAINFFLPILLSLATYWEGNSQKYNELISQKHQENLG